MAFCLWRCCIFMSELVVHTGKMFKSRVSRGNKALCFVVNKGYFELDDLRSMLAIVDDLDDFDNIKLVGGIEKVTLDSDNVVYRQRVFFKSLTEMLSNCKRYGVLIKVPEGFSVGINCILNCTDDLPFLERYAFNLGESIDNWLTTSCKIHLLELAKSVGVDINLSDNDFKSVRNKGYLNRAPFLICSYNIDKKESGIFLHKSDYYSNVSDICNLASYGYTDLVVRKDKGCGLFDTKKRSRVTRFR